MTTKNAAYDTKIRQLSDKLADLEKEVAALRTLVKPGFDTAKFHTFYDPILDTAKEAHDVYHELLHAGGHSH